MKPGIYNFTVQQGDTFALQLDYKTAASSAATPAAVDLTGAVVSSQIRVAQDKTSALLATFTCPITVPLSGKFELRLTASQTAALDFSVGYYDVQVTSSDGTKRTILEGRVTLNREVTNA